MLLIQDEKTNQLKGHEDIINRLLYMFDLSAEDFYSDSRNRKLSDLRIVVAHILRVHPNIRLGVADTGRLFQRHHSCIIFYLKQVSEASKFNRILYQKLVYGHSIIFGHIDYLTDFHYNCNHKRNLL